MVRLPSPPTDSEKWAYLKQEKFKLYSFGVVSTFLLFCGMALFSFSHPSFYAYFIFAGFTFVYLIISYYVGIFAKGFDLRRHERILKIHATLPTIDVYLPCCNEPYELLKNTYTYVKNLQYPRDKLFVHVLDDGDNDKIAPLVKEFGFNYIKRPNKGELKKAGNLRYAFANTAGEFILILDADFCPRPEMLQEMVCYFAENPKLGILQSPQFFTVEKETQGWVEAGAGWIQETFYRLINVSRSHHGAPICVGTCALYRRKALEPEGTAAIPYSEDLHTGFETILKGWTVEYIPVNYSKGVCPDSVGALFSQMYRWALGSTSLLLTKKFWTVKIGFNKRMCFLSGMIYYWATALGIFTGPIPGILMVWFLPEFVFWYNYLLTLPSFIYGTLWLKYWSYHPWGLYALKARQVSYYAHFYAIKDKLMGQVQGWVSTGSVQAKSAGRFGNFRSLLFWWNTSCLVIISAGITRGVMHGHSLIHFIPMIFFSLFNYYIQMTCLRDQ